MDFAQYTLKFNKDINNSSFIFKELKNISKNRFNNLFLVNRYKTKIYHRNFKLSYGDNKIIFINMPSPNEIRVTNIRGFDQTKFITYINWSIVNDIAMSNIDIVDSIKIDSFDSRISLEYNGNSDCYFNWLKNNFKGTAEELIALYKYEVKLIPKQFLKNDTKYLTML